MIPRIFHWNWLSDDPMPERFMDFMLGWIRLHPGWKVYLWTAKNVPTLFNQACFGDASSWAIKSSILRLELMNKYGGIYLDSDYECHQPIDALLDRDVLLGYETDDSICDAIMGSVPGHRFFMEAVKDYEKWYDEHKDKPHPIQTPYPPAFGPEYITHVFNSSRLWKMSIRPITNRKILYPYFCGEEPQRYPETIASHHWAGTWRGKP